MIIPATAFVFFTAFMYTLHSVLVKTSSGRVDPYSGMFFWSLGAFIIGTAAFLYGKYVVQATDINFSGAAILIVAGAVICAGSIGYLLAYERGVELSFAAPVVNISVVMGGMIVGMLLFKEGVSLERIIGVLLGGTAIYLITKG